MGLVFAEGVVTALTVASTNLFFQATAEIDLDRLGDVRQLRFGELELLENSSEQNVYE